MIETRQARYFVAVAEELHFGRAAALLQMSQPPLSQAIRALERQVGAKLLDRNSRGVALTPAGTAFLRACRVLIASADRAQDAATQAQTGTTGTLRLGAVATAFFDPLPALLDRFRADRPNVELRVTEIDTHEGRDALLRGELDAAVVRQTPSDRRLNVIPLRRDRLVVALPTAHPLAKQRTELDLTVAADLDWVWLPRRISPDYHDELVAACRRYGFSPRATHNANSISSQLAMVACGLGITLVPHSSARQHDRGIAYRTLDRPIELVELSLLLRHDNNDPALHAFIRSAARSSVITT